jgi:hypothetical protein
MEIEDLLRYDPETGLLHWKVYNNSRAPKDGVAGYERPDGYIEVRVNRKAYYAHRIAFYLMTGRWPDKIDHINRIRNDNRWCNIRECGNSDNLKNRTTTNKFGHKGITKRGNRFIVTGHNHKYLKMAKTLEEAILISNEYYGEYS